MFAPVSTLEPPPALKARKAISYPSEEEWETLFANSKHRAQQALAEKKTSVFLTILFDRLYTLRNQLIHGGATWNSQMNREQLSSAVRILHDFVPELIRILMENPEEYWGEPQYPPVGER